MTIVVPADGDDLDPLWGVDITDAVNDLLAAVNTPWGNWVPTLGSLTKGNGTQVARYRQIGTTIHWRYRLILGTTSAVGLDPSITLPVPPHADYVDANFGMIPVGHSYLLNFGANTWTGPVVVFSGSTAVIKYSNEADGGWAGAINTTVPHTWGSTDALIAFGTYEAA